MTNPTAHDPSEEKTFYFPHGIYGFPDARRFLVSEIPGGGEVFRQMLAVDQQGLGFTLVHPFVFFPDYQPEIPDAELRTLEAEDAAQLVIMAIATVPAQFREATANLKAPLLFNPYTRKGCQVILAEERYQTRHRLFPA